MDVSLSINWSVFVVQLINFALVYWLFHRFVAKPLIESLLYRREQVRKAEHAEQVYEETLAKAEEEKKAIITEAVDHKNKLVEQAQIAAKQKADGIVQQAQKAAQHIEEKAQQKAQKLEQELKNDFVDGVKQTAHVVVKKLFDKDVDLQQKYLDTLVSEFAK